MKNDETAQLWRDRFAACKSSGLQVTEYCRQNGLRTRGYYYWKRRLEKTDENASATGSPNRSIASWLSVETSSSRSVSKTLLLQPTLTIRVSGAEIEVSADFNPGLLRAVVSALGPQAC